MLRVEVRHNGFTRPCRQMRVNIGPADTKETAHKSIVASAAAALNVAFNADAKLFTPSGAEVNALLLEKDDLLYVDFSGAPFTSPADAE